MSATHVLAWIAGTMLSVAAGLVLVRIARGPTMLDRVVAMDVLVALLVCAIGLEAAVDRHTTTLPILIAIALVGFVGAVSVAWFLGRGGGPVDAGSGVDRDAPDDAVVESTDTAGSEETR